jgi:exopolyphosphatase/guanosine-5'-triphosphate,3'-diphosphate pyrophosphatase
MVRMLCRSTITARRKIVGLEQGREDIILAGAVVIQEIMQKSGFTNMLVSDWGLREGILFDLYDKIIQRS